MSTIEGANQKGAVPSHSDRAGYAFSQKAGWLRELERAQWRERLRYQPRAGGEDGTPDAGECAVGNAERGEMPCMAEEPVAADWLGMAHVDPQVPAAASAGAGCDVVLREPNEHGQDGVGTPAGMAGAPVGGADGGPDVPEPVSGRSPPAEPSNAKSPMAPGEWEKQTIYVIRREDEVRVWLRDSRLDSQKGLEVLERVAAELRGLGNRLVCLNLNGREIARVGQV